MKKLFLFQFLILISGLVQAQLSGVYTVGGPDPDFNTLTDAIDTISNSGISGHTVIQIHTGNYYGFTLENFNNPGDDTLIITSESLNADLVTLTGPTKLLQTSNIILQHLSFLPDNISEEPALIIEECDNILVQSTNIINPDGVSFDYPDCLLMIKFPSSGPIKHIKVTGSYLQSAEDILKVSGSKTDLLFENNVFEGGFTAGASMDIVYRSNEFYFDDYDFAEGYAYFKANSFYFSGPGYLWVAGELDGNDFHTGVRLEASNCYANHFYGDVDISHHDVLSFRHNTVEGELKVIFSHYGAILRNVLKGGCLFNSDGLYVIGNFFYDTVRFSHGPQQKIFFNNFHPDALLRTSFIGGDIVNNNLSNLEVLQPGITHVRGNNFVLGTTGYVTTYGESPHFYDPKYTGPDDLHAANPALIGKCVELWAGYAGLFKYDIDSIERGDIKTIGASEVCLAFDESGIDLFCDDSICLDPCIEEFSGYFWTPSWLFEDSTMAAPVLYPDTSVTVYLNNIIMGVIDSVQINNLDHAPVAWFDYELDGSTISCTNRSTCDTAVLWYFGDGTYSTLENPVHTWTQSGVYVVSLTATNSLGSNVHHIYVDILVGKDETTVSPVEIYPNPAHQVLFIKLAASSQKNVQISISDISGKKLIYKNLNQSTNSVDLTSLSSGLYFLKIATINGNFSQKIIVR